MGKGTMKKPRRLLRVIVLFLSVNFGKSLPAVAQEAPPLQPLAANVRQIESALSYLGSALSADDQRQIDDTPGGADEAAAMRAIEATLDKRVPVTVGMNAENRVTVQAGEAKPELIKGGTRVFLVKVINRGGVTSPLEVESPNNGRVYVKSDGSPEPPQEFTPEEARERWADISLFDKNQLATHGWFPARLSGISVEYRILENYSHDRGQRSAKISFNVGQGTQDIGFRNEIDLLFNVLPAHLVRLHVVDEKGEPATVRVTVKAAAMLDVTLHPEIHNLPVDQKPFFRVERARIGDTRQVPWSWSSMGNLWGARPSWPTVLCVMFSSNCPSRRASGGVANSGLIAYEPHLCGRRGKTHPRLA